MLVLGTLFPKGLPLLGPMAMGVVHLDSTSLIYLVHLGPIDLACLGPMNLACSGQICLACMLKDGLLITYRLRASCHPDMCPCTAAVDLSVGQNSLLELKVAGIKHLKHSEFVRLVGHSPSSNEER